MSTTAHSQTRARSWALPCRHALKHRLRPSFTPGHHWRRLPASAPGPTTPPAQGHPFGRASHDHLDATWSLGKSTALFHCSSQRHSPWAQAPVAPAARLQDPPAPVPSICHLARAPEPPPPPPSRHRATRSAFPPPQHHKEMGSPSQCCLGCSLSTQGRLWLSQDFGAPSPLSPHRMSLLMAATGWLVLPPPGEPPHCWD